MLFWRDAGRKACPVTFGPWRRHRFRRWQALKCGLVGLLAMLGLASTAAGLTLSQVERTLRRQADANPAWLQPAIIGTSQRGHPIRGLILKDPDAQPRYGIMVNAAHHGDEVASVAAALGLFEALLAPHQRPRLKQYLQNFKVILVPVVNPDGFVMGSRYDANGRDLNRAYPFPGDVWGARLTKETRQLHDFIQDLDVVVVGAFALHSGMEGVLWPWCYSPEPVAEDADFRYLARGVAQAMGLVYARQSSLDYASRGEFIDYMYMVHGAYALTVELALESRPPPASYPALVARTAAGLWAYMERLQRLMNGEAPLRLPLDFSSHRVETLAEAGRV